MTCGGFVLPKKSSRAKTLRIPEKTGGIQVNFCKNPQCKNFGVPAKQKTSTRASESDGYVVVGTGEGRPGIKCKACGEIPRLKSNLGIKQECDRISQYLVPRRESSCPDVGCGNHAIGVLSGPQAYYLHGHSRAGSTRHKCKTCGKTFAVGKSTRGQKAPEKNRQIFMELVNGNPINRICELANVQPQTVYEKIDFFQAQCLKFLGDRERRLKEGFPIEKLYLSSDRQEYIVNWTHRKDKRTTQLSAIGTADNRSGYVFGMHLNFDPDTDAIATEAAAHVVGDYHAQPPFRQFARLWLEQDYGSEENRFDAAPQKITSGNLINDIEYAYNVVARREDTEISNRIPATHKLPDQGMQVHAEYTLYAHFQFLRLLFSGVEKLRFFLDQDSGMRAACLSAFQAEIRTNKADAFFVSIDTSMTQDQKRKEVSLCREAFKREKDRFTGKNDYEVKIELVKEQLANMPRFGPWGDRWLFHPFPTMQEPKMAICHLTDQAQYDIDHLAGLYLKASKSSIDVFFQMVRSRLSELSRGVPTAGGARRICHRNSPYNPKMIEKQLIILRTYVNYCLPPSSKNPNTRAMRLGLAKGKVRVEDILYYC
jgi:hypothetical protein